jgi:hypothetical protein
MKSHILTLQVEEKQTIQEISAIPSQSPSQYFHGLRTDTSHTWESPSDKSTRVKGKMELIEFINIELHRIQIEKLKDKKRF